MRKVPGFQNSNLILLKQRLQIAHQSIQINRLFPTI